MVFTNTCYYCLKGSPYLYLYLLYANSIKNTTLFIKKLKKLSQKEKKMSETMQKINVMGKTNSQPQPNNNPKQIVNVTYGHNGSGKLYSYYGQNKRAGDIVTPEVTHPKSGKIYKTLAVIKSTHTIPQSQDIVSYLNNKNIDNFHTPLLTQRCYIVNPQKQSLYSAQNASRLNSKFHIIVPI